MAQEINVLTELGLKQYTETLVRWIKSKLDVKAEGALNLDLTAEGNEVKLSLFSGNTLLSCITLPIVNDRAAGLITPTLLAQMNSGGEGNISIQTLVDGTNVEFLAMEPGNVYIKDGRFYIPVITPSGELYDVIEFGERGVINKNDEGEERLYATLSDLDNINTITDNELNKNSDNPVQNWVISLEFEEVYNEIRDIYTEINRLNTLQNTVDSNTELITVLNELFTSFNTSINGSIQRISNLEEKVNVLERQDNDSVSKGELDDLETQISNLKGLAINVDGTNYRFNNLTKRLLKHTLSVDSQSTWEDINEGYYIINYNGQCYIYDASNNTKSLLSNAKINPLDKILDVLVIDSGISGIREGKYGFDIDYNQIYYHVPGSRLIDYVGNSGENCIISYTDDNDITSYYFCIIGKGYYPIYTGNTDEFVSKNDLIQGIGNVIVINHWVPSVPFPGPSDEGEYIFNTSNNIIYIHNSANNIVPINTHDELEPKYLVYNNDLDSGDNRGQYFIVTIGQSCQRVVLNGIEEIKILHSDVVDTLHVDSNNNTRSVTINLSSLESQSEPSNTVTPQKIIQIANGYFDVDDETLKSLTANYYGLDENNRLRIGSGDSSTSATYADPGNYLITYNNELYLLIITATQSGSLGQRIKLASFANISEVNNGAIVGINDSNNTPIPVSNGVATLPDYVTSEYLLENYSTNSSINTELSYYVKRTELESNSWNKIVYIDSIESSTGVNNVSNQQYQFNAADQQKLVIINGNSNNNGLWLKVTKQVNNNITKIYYYKSWVEIADKQILKWNEYSNNDLFYTIKDNKISFWKWNTSSNTYIEYNNVDQIISGLDSIISEKVNSEVESEIDTYHLNDFQTNIENQIAANEISNKNIAIVESSHIYNELPDSSNINSSSYYIICNGNDITSGTLWYKNNEGQGGQIQNSYLVLIIEENIPKLYLYTYNISNSTFTEISSSNNVPSEEPVIDPCSNIKIIAVGKWNTNAAGVITTDENEYIYNEVRNTLYQGNTNVTDSLLKVNNLFIDCQHNDIYRYSGLGMIKLSTSNEEGTEVPTDEELNIILKETADLLKWQAQNINQLKISKTHIDDINKKVNELYKYEFGYGSLDKFDEQPNNKNVGDLILYKSTTTSPYRIYECTKVHYPIVSIEISKSKTYVGNISEFSDEVNLLKNDSNLIIEKIKLDIPALSIYDYRNKIIEQFVNNGYTLLEDNCPYDVASQCPGSVYAYDGTGYLYIKVVTKSRNGKILTSDNFENESPSLNYYIGDTSSPLIYCQGNTNTDAYYSVNPTCDWNPRNNNDKEGLHGNILPTEGVVTGQCFFLEDDDKGTFKPYWARVNQGAIRWYDANGILKK